MCNYFQKQRVDVAGVLAVRLQKLLVVFYSFSLISVAFFGYVNLTQHLVIWPFLLLSLCWLVWGIGWKGASQRQPCLLLAYFVFTLIGSVLLLIGFVMTSVGGSIVTVLNLNDCIENGNCHDSMDQQQAEKDMENYPLIIAFIFGFSILIFIVPLFMNIIGMFLALAVRAELKSTRPLPGNNKLELEQSFKMGTMKAVPEPMVYAIPQQSLQGYHPVNTGTQGMIMYVPVPQGQIN